MQRNGTNSISFSLSAREKKTKFHFRLGRRLETRLNYSIQRTIMIFEGSCGAEMRASGLREIWPLDMCSTAAMCFLLSAGTAARKFFPQKKTSFHQTAIKGWAKRLRDHPRPHFSNGMADFIFFFLYHILLPVFFYNRIVKEVFISNFEIYLLWHFASYSPKVKIGPVAMLVLVISMLLRQVQQQTSLYLCYEVLPIDPCHDAVKIYLRFRFLQISSL